MTTRAAAKAAISELEAHLETCLRLCRDHEDAAKGYERAGNTSAAIQMRSVAGVLGALARGDKVHVITPAPTINGISEIALDRLRRVWRSLGKECEDLANGREREEDFVELRPAAKVTPLIAKPEVEPPKPTENLATMSEERFNQIFPPVLREARRAEAKVAAVQKTSVAADMKAAGALPRCEFRILAVLEMYKHDQSFGVPNELGGLLRSEVALAAVYAPKGGTFLRAIGSLRQRGLIENTDDLRLRITSAGRIALGKPLALPTGYELVNDWNHELEKAERESLRVLLDHYPKELTKQQIAEATGYEVKGGTFLRSLGHLRSLGLITGSKHMKASAMLSRKP